MIFWFFINKRGREREKSKAKMTMVRLFKDVDTYVIFCTLSMLEIFKYIHNYDKIKAENLCIYVAD